jgi:hypothetical protein
VRWHPSIPIDFHPALLQFEGYLDSVVGNYADRTQRGIMQAGQPHDTIEPPGVYAADNLATGSDTR